MISIKWSTSAFVVVSGGNTRTICVPATMNNIDDPFLPYSHNLSHSHQLQDRLVILFLGLLLFDLYPQLIVEVFPIYIPLWYLLLPIQLIR